MPHSTMKVPALVSIVRPSLPGHTPVEVATGAVEVVVAVFDDIPAGGDLVASVVDVSVVEVESAPVSTLVVDTSAAAVVVEDLLDEDLPELGIGEGSLQELT